jgi:two-component system chemotaxis sensor kinase CheA
MQQVLAAFQEEQAEHCQAIGDILLQLERNPQHAQREKLITQLFREAHSLKGGARAAGIESVEQIAHRVEDLFSAVRQEHVQLTAEACDLVYAAIEAVNTLMGRVAANRPATLEPYLPLLHSLGRLLGEEAPDAPPAEVASDEPPATAEPAQPAAAEEPAPAATPADELPPDAMQPTDAASEQAAAKADAPAASNEARPEEVQWETANTTVRLSTVVLDSLMNETGELITSAVRAQQRTYDARSLGSIPARWRRIWRHVNPIITRIQQQQPELQPTVHHMQDREQRLFISDTSSAVSLDQHDVLLLLDALAQANTLLSDIDHHLSDHVRASVEDSTRLSAVTGRLQDQIRRTRMLPLNTLLSPLRVQMREMMRMAGKQIELQTEGGEVEADRQVLESLREVLLHLLRNAVDHGIEAAEVRKTRNKPQVGYIALRAAVSGDYLDLSIEDDGAGLDVDAIRQRALVDGLVNEADLSRLSDTDFLDLVFLPGFSTRRTVDKLSGRGVGLDVVRSQIERMHGQVSIQNYPGAGCVFLLRVPLSLTSSHGLLLRVNQGIYMLPLESIQRIVSIEPRDIHMVEGHAAIMLDGRPLAVIHLADLIGEAKRSATSSETPSTRMTDQATSVDRRSLALLLGSGERQVACLVDAVLGEQELVVHRLPFPLQRVRFIAGATILADGKVVPILDLVDILRSAIGTRSMISVVEAAETPDHTPGVLVVDDSITTRTLEKNILEAAGYRVHLAIDGVEALQMLHSLTENGGCDLLLSDIDMPNLNGFDLTTQVRNDPVLKHLPIVLVTSLDTPSDRERGLAAGADAYIVKRAFDQQTLLDTIAHLI